MTEENVEEERVDFILVTDKDRIMELYEYIRNLEAVGLRFQLDHEKEGGELLFLKIMIPPDALDHFAKVYNFNIARRKRFEAYDRGTQKGIISRLDVYKKDGVALTAEKIKLIHNLLEITAFGSGENMYGLSELLRHHIVRSAYPLHDGTAEWQDTDKPLNDRQLLFKHWANLGVWYKKQPLDLIEKYYGAEVAFYFAWIGFYNKMLIVAAIFGIICFTSSFIMYLNDTNPLVKDICESKEFLCPPCNSKKYCNFHHVSHNCFYAKWGSIFDSYPSVAFAVFMAFWSRLFLTLWKRNEYKLKLRWNISVEDVNTDYRMEYKEKASQTKLSSVSGLEEPYVSKITRCIHLAITLAICTVLIFMVFLAIFCVIYYKMMVKMMLGHSSNSYIKNNAKNIATITGSILQVLFMRLFGKVYGNISHWLTDMENPRTQLEYDNSYMYKKFSLYFVNYYSAFFYAAFVKGRFYSSPDKQGSMNAFQRDVCAVTCIVELNIYLIVLLLFKKLIGNIIVYLLPKIKRFCGNDQPRSQYEHLPQWEQENKLGSLDRYHVTSEINEMVIEYGCVTFFAAAFPLAPLLALFNNVFELRLDAFKLVKRFQRPIPRKSPGIGSWNGVLLGMTFLGTVTNAFIVAFTSHFVPRELYMYENDSSLKGFVNSTFSSFATKDFEIYKSVKSPEICYYESNRFPHDHIFKYKHKEDYWIHFTWRLVCVLVFEHLIMMMTGVLGYIIPSIPTSVKTKLSMDQHEIKKAKLKLLNEEKKKIAAKRKLESQKGKNENNVSSKEENHAPNN